MMTKSRRSAGINPFMGYLMPSSLIALMVKNTEIALASQQTVWHRMLMMGRADATALSHAEQKEFSRMYTETLRALVECGQIMAREIARLNQQSATLAWSQSVSTAIAMGSLATGRNPADVLAAQSRFMSAAGQRAFDAWQEICAAITRASTKGVAPVHKAVTANAQRLGRKKR
ncbi:MAG: phasin family protein [Nitrococcus sp.]|nr:phasin family protein [Nitrococcus sp.]